MCVQPPKTAEVMLAVNEVLGGEELPETENRRALVKKLISRLIF